MRSGCGRAGYLSSEPQTRCRFMRVMGLEVIKPWPKLSRRHQVYPVYPYLLLGLIVIRPNQVWAVDITYLSLSGGHVYLKAALDWHGRLVLS